MNGVKGDLIPVFPKLLWYMDACKMSGKGQNLVRDMLPCIHSRLMSLNFLKAHKVGQGN